MKKQFFLLCAMLLMAMCANSQTNPIVGDWNGVLKFQGMQLRIVFHVQESDGNFSGTMDSPDQSAFGLPATSVKFDGQNLEISLVNMGIKYAGKLVNGEVEGTFSQAGYDAPMTLQTKPIEKVEIQRAQTPHSPYPYYTEEVKFENPGANAVLAGTLSLPSKDGVFPVVVFISGSGQQDRDEDAMGHKPFLVISDYLARNGIASLRFDDRGMGASTGDPKGATSADFATDVESAIAYLKTRKEVDPHKIGLLGHSEGGLIAPMVASHSKDVAFIVSFAGPGMPGVDLILLQSKLILAASGASEELINQTLTENRNLFDLILSSTDDSKLGGEIEAYVRGQIDKGLAVVPQGIDKEQYIAMNVQQVADPWMVAFIRSEPSKFLEKTKCPYLAINGERDLQVSCKENLQIISESLKKARNKNVTIKSFPGLNHMFQTCNTGLPSEYATIDQTIAPEVLEYVTEWILKQTK